MKFLPAIFKPKQLKGLECLNCEQPMRGHENFCSYCGQKNTVKKLSFGIFLNNMVSGITNYDSRLWRTFIPLLTKPGKVSKEFIQGKRVKFVNPFQLYLNVSIVFFLLLGVSDFINVNDTGSKEFVINLDDETKDSIVNLGSKELDTLLTDFKTELKKSIPADSSNAQVVTDIDQVFELIDAEKKKFEPDSLTASKEHIYFIDSDTTGSIKFTDRMKDFTHFEKKHPEMEIENALDSLGYEIGFWNKFLYQTSINSNNNMELFKTAKGRKELGKKITSYLSISLFVFLPIFTLFLKILYFRRKYTYMEHLVFVFHTQTVFFLLFVIFYLINLFADLQNVIWVFFILFLLYLYKALRYFYGQRRFKTIVKFVLMNGYYLFLGSVGFTIVAALSFILS